MPKPLTEPVLRRLTTEALVSFLGQAERFEAVLRPGSDLVLCREPVADLNYVVAGKGASDDSFRAACETCLSQQIPFLAIIFPEAGARPAEVAAELGLEYAVDFPIMVRDDRPIEPSGNDSVVVEPETGTADALRGIGVVSAAFHMPLNSPALEIYSASIEGRLVGSVTLTHHGDTVGIWAMATDPEVQSRGIGRRLLSTAMSECRESGARRFFLGATPAGFPLYEKLGFETRVVTSVWVSGETGQA